MKLKHYLEQEDDAVQEENEPIEVKGSKAPLPTTMDEGPDKEGGRGEEIIPE